MPDKATIKFRKLRKILLSFGVVENRSRGKGGHILFSKGSVSYTIVAKKNDVNGCYIRGARRAFKLTPADGVSDREFYSRG